MALIEAIITLRQRGWSRRRIARELGVNRDTVNRYLRSVVPDSKPAITPVNSEPIGDDSKPAIAPTGSPPSGNSVEA
jgi:hypothetical protein